jgi:hypothetical protein
MVRQVGDQEIAAKLCMLITKILDTLGFNPMSPAGSTSLN